MINRLFLSPIRIILQCCLGRNSGIRLTGDGSIGKDKDTEYLHLFTKPFLPPHLFFLHSH